MKIRTQSKVQKFFQQPGKMPRRYKGEITEGRKGVAVGDSRNPNISEENLAKVQGNRGVVSASDVEAFMYEGKPLFVNSSNVYFARFFHHTEQMLVVFLSDKTQGYLYHSVSEEKALDFAQTLSKGMWIWDNIRVRGSKTAHKKQFSKVAWNYQPPGIEKREFVLPRGKKARIGRSVPRV